MTPASPEVERALNDLEQQGKNYGKLTPYCPICEPTRHSAGIIAAAYRRQADELAATKEAWNNARQRILEQDQEIAQLQEARSVYRAQRQEQEVRAERAESERDAARAELEAVTADRNSWAKASRENKTEAIALSARISRLTKALEEVDEFRREVHAWMQDHPCCDSHVSSFAEFCGSPDDDFKPRWVTPAAPPPQSGGEKEAGR